MKVSTLIMLILMFQVQTVLASPLFIEGSAGMSQYQLGADGCWQKTGYYTENHSKDFAWSVGLSQEPIALGDFSLGWVGAYQDLGNIRTHNKQCNAAGSNTDLCFANPKLSVVEPWDNGNGSVKGAILGLTTRYRIWDKLSVQIEGGAWLYWANFDVQVNNSTYYMDSAGQLSYYYGARVQYRWFFIGARFFPDTIATANYQGAQWQGIYRGVNYYEIGLSIPLW